MDTTIQIILTVFSSVLASSGLWAYLQKRSEKKDVKTNHMRRWVVTGRLNV